MPIWHSGDRVYGIDRKQEEQKLLHAWGNTLTSIRFGGNLGKQFGAFITHLTEEKRFPKLETLIFYNLEKPTLDNMNKLKKWFEDAKVAKLAIQFVSVWSEVKEFAHKWSAEYYDKVTKGEIYQIDKDLVFRF